MIAHQLIAAAGAGTAGIVGICAGGIGAGRADVVAVQLAYLVSGGLGGLGLVILGACLAVLWTMRASDVDDTDAVADAVHAFVRARTSDHRRV